MVEETQTRNFLLENVRKRESLVREVRDSTGNGEGRDETIGMRE